jgi:signal transduction histidine kinase
VNPRGARTSEEEDVAASIAALFTRRARSAFAQSYRSRLPEVGPMHAQPVGNPPFTEVDYVCVSTNLMTKMMSELQSLRVHNQWLTLGLATAGHDLRGRLQTLMGTIELLSVSRDALRTADLSRRAKSMILRLAQELEQLAYQAEKPAEHAVPSTYSFLLSSLLAKLRNDWQPIAERKYLAFNVVETDCIVESDQRLLGVILDNVVGNAVRHTLQGGVLVATQIEQELLVLTVSDTGPGISAQDLQRSHSFNARCGGLDQGMGLGLCIARKTAELLGHRFDVSTGAHLGTCIRLYVPLAELMTRPTI